MMTGPVFRIRRFLVGAAAVALALATVACAAAPTATPTGSPTPAPTGGPTAAPTPDLSGQEKYLTVKIDPVYPLAAGTNTLDPAYVRSL